MKNIGDEIRRRREARNWRQIDLAKRMRRPQSVISDLEAGNTDPRFSQLQRLAKIFACTVNDLTDGAK